MSHALTLNQQRGWPNLELMLSHHLPHWIKIPCLPWFHCIPCMSYIPSYWHLIERVESLNTLTQHIIPSGFDWRLLCDANYSDKCVHIIPNTWRPITSVWRLYVSDVSITSTWYAMPGAWRFSRCVTCFAISWSNVRSAWRQFQIYEAEFHMCVN